MINSTNLLTLKLHNLNKTENTTNQTSAVTSPLEKKEVKSGLLNAYLNNMALINTPAVKKVDSAPKVINYHNDLRTLLKNNEAKILAIVPRTFNAKDINGNPSAIKDILKQQNNRVSHKGYHFKRIT